MQRPEFAAPSLWLIACIALCVFGLTHNMAGYALFDPDEGRNAEIAREMAVSGDYVLPHLNGLPYLDKPVLYFAAGAISMRLFGPTEFSTRLPSLLFTFATIILVGWFANKIFGRAAGLTAAIATAATPFTLAYARIVIFDSALTFFLVLALVCFYLAIEERLERGRAGRRAGGQSIAGDPTTRPPERRSAMSEFKGGGEGWAALAWVAIAFGVLTKGPVAIVLPLLVALPFAIRYRAARALADPVALLLFAATIAPWVLAVSIRIPDFLEYVVITESAGRFATSELERTGPLWYFLAIFPAAALPWTAVLAGATRECAAQRESDGRIDRRILFLLFWIFLPLLFFTLSQSKRPQYILPIVPAVALLIAAIWSRRPRDFPGARVGAIALLALGLIFIAASNEIPRLVPANQEIAAAIPGTALILGSACLVGGMVAWFARHRLELLLLAFTLPVVAIPLSSHSLMRAIGNDRSAVLLARAIDDATANTPRVVGVAAYPPSLPFYLQSTVIVATDDGSELTSNYLTRHVHEYRGLGYPLRRLDWWREALVSCSEPTVFVAATRDADARDALRQLNLIFASEKYVAYGPCDLETLARTE